MRQFHLSTLLAERGASLQNIVDEEFDEMADVNPTHGFYVFRPQITLLFPWGTALSVTISSKASSQVMHVLRLMSPSNLPRKTSH